MVVKRSMTLNRFLSSARLAAQQQQTQGRSENPPPPPSPTRTWNRQRIID